MTALLQSPLAFRRWRLSAELLGYAIARLFPDVQLIGGDVNSLGFYCDLIFSQPFKSGMFELVEVELQKLIKEDRPVRYLSMMRENAQALFMHRGLPFFSERVGEEECNIVEVMQVEDFYALCPDLSLPSTSDAGHVKLLEMQEQENQVTRLIGTSQSHAKELKAFLKNYESLLKKKDHRLLGPQLKLFSLTESNEIFWHPKGHTLRRLLQEVAETMERDVWDIATPLVVNDAIRSSFLPQHLEYLKTTPFRSEELPIRLREFGEVCQFYPELLAWGLFCHSQFFSQQTTICCPREHVLLELISSLHLIEEIITIFGFEARWALVAAKDKSPSRRVELEALGLLQNPFHTGHCRYALAPEIGEEEGGETPRLELRVCDVIGREWAVSMVSVVPLPLKIDRLPPLVVLKRQICVSFDRVIALLIEQGEGTLPFWLAPEQVRVIAIGEESRDYAAQISSSLMQGGWRVQLDGQQGKLGERIHAAEKEHVPFMIAVGEKERAKQKLSVREAGQSNYREMDLEEFLEIIKRRKLNQLES